MSRFVGQKLSGNGDILSFGTSAPTGEIWLAKTLPGYSTSEIVNGLGSEGAPEPCGPTITGAIDNRRASPNVLDGYIIQEGAIPRALAPLIQPVLELLPGKVYPAYTIMERFQNLFSRVKSGVLGPYASGGSMNRTQTYLIMSHDGNEGVQTLADDKPHLKFLGVGRTEHVKKLNLDLANATSAVGGTLVHSPFMAGEYSR
jgi:hypothetical protein